MYQVWGFAVYFSSASLIFFVRTVVSLVYYVAVFSLCWIIHLVGYSAACTRHVCSPERITNKTNYITSRAIIISVYLPVSCRFFTTRLLSYEWRCLQNLIIQRRGAVGRAKGRNNSGTLGASPRVTTFGTISGWSMIFPYPHGVGWPSGWVGWGAGPYLPLAEAIYSWTVESRVWRKVSVLTVNRGLYMAPVELPSTLFEN